MDWRKVEHSEGRWFESSPRYQGYDGRQGCFLFYLICYYIAVMPFCPECRDEFQDWVKTCPDCKVPLVDKLLPLPPPRSLFNNEPMVCVATAPNEQIASLWAGILEDSGIHAVLKSDNLRAAMYVLLTNHYYTIHVLESSAPRARSILSPIAETHKEYTYARDNWFSLKHRIFLIIMYLLWWGWGGA